MGRFEHGGDTYGLGDVLDFSSSLNPLGTPVQIVRALKVAAGDFSTYPDPQCRDLVAALAKAEGVPAANIVATAGATDAFSRIAWALQPRKVLLCSPCYSGYEQALRQVNARIVRHSLMPRENFDVTGRILDYLDPEIDLVLLCTPNNPTGRSLSFELLQDILDKAAKNGTWVVVDESFLEFTTARSATALINRYPRLIVVKTFTKTFAIAGLRIGWCVCSTATVAQSLRDAGMPWIVSTPAQVAALAALEMPDYLEATRAYLAKARPLLEDGLESAGMSVVPSHANYILFQSPKPLYGPLLERGILIRQCENFRGLDASWFRVAVRTIEDNERLLNALREVGA